MILFYCNFAIKNKNASFILHGNAFCNTININCVSFSVDLEKIKEYSLKKITKSTRDKIKSEIKSFYENLFKKKITDIDDNSKLKIYKTLKNSGNISEENYLSCPKLEYRKLITKYRISDHNLLIEKGRYFKIPREERLCKKCKKIEDETHFILYCENTMPQENIICFFFK